MPRSTANLALLLTAITTPVACSGPSITIQAEATEAVDMSKMPAPNPQGTTLPIPILDQHQPAAIQTATFALG